LAGLRIRRFDPIAEASELPDHSRRPALFRLAPSDNRSTKSADGRVATEAAWLNGDNLEKEETKEAEREKKRKDERKV
jgi:hypothetical protein